MTVGTPSYMAPEQFLSAKTVDHRADVWALGIVAFRMLTGKLPFDGDSPTALAVAIATQPPLDLATLVPSLPPEAVAAIMGALEKDPAKRHQDVFAFGRALEPFGTKRVPFASAAARVVPALAVGSEPTKREGAADRPGRAAPVAIVVKVPSAPMVPDRVDVAPPALQRRSRAPLVLAALALGVAAAGAIVAFYMQADARTVTVAADRTTTTAGAAVSVTATASTPAAPEAPEASATTTSAEEAGVAPAPSTAPAFVVPDDLPDPWLRPAADGSQQR
jgi:serine/threonine-protein kinase